MMTNEMRGLLNILVESRDEQGQVQTNPGLLRSALGERAKGWDIRGMIFRLIELGKVDQKYAEGGGDGATLILTVWG